MVKVLGDLGKMVEMERGKMFATGQRNDGRPKLTVRRMS